MTLLSSVQPLASMEEAWVGCARLQAESDRLGVEAHRLWIAASRLRAEIEHLGNRLLVESHRLQAESGRLRAECDRVWAEAELTVIITAQAFYGRDVQIDWREQTARPYPFKEGV